MSRPIVVISSQPLKPVGRRLGLAGRPRSLNFEHPWILDIAAKLRLGISLRSWRSADGIAPA